jgi:hypothetical protein
MRVQPESFILAAWFCVINITLKMVAIHGQGTLQLWDSGVSAEYKLDMKNGETHLQY